jgi:hypothetical protein
LGGRGNGWKIQTEPVPDFACPMCAVQDARDEGMARGAYSDDADHSFRFDGDHYSE